MDKVKFAKASRKHTIITVLGITSLALLMLVNIAGAAPYVYISNYAGNNVSVINTTINTVTATVSVGNSPVGVAVTPD
jgi:YVTN family beta-propeller protein